MRAATSLKSLQTAAVSGNASSEELLRLTVRVQSFNLHEPQLILPIVSALLGNGKVLKPSASATDDSVSEALFRLASQSCGADVRGLSVRDRALAFGANPESEEGGLTEALLTDEEAKSVAFREGEVVTDALKYVRLKLTRSGAESIVVLSMAHLMQTAVETCKRDTSAEIKTAALEFICAAVDAFPSERTACFLPGIATGLGTVLRRCRLERSSVTVALLRAFVVYIVASFSKVENVEENEGKSPLEVIIPFDEMVKSRQSQPREDSRQVTEEEGSQRVETPGLSGIWAVGAAEKVSNIIAVVVRSRDGPAEHSAVWARHAFVSACAALLGAPGLSLLSPTRAGLVDSLAVRRSDENEDVANCASASFERLLRAGKVDFGTLRTGVGRIVAALSTEEGHETESGGSKAGTFQDRRSDRGTSNPSDAGPGPEVRIADVTQDDRWLFKLHGFILTLEEHSELLRDTSALISGFPFVASSSTRRTESLAVVKVVSSFDMTIFAHIISSAFGLPEAQSSSLPGQGEEMAFTPTQRRAVAVASCLGRSGCLPSLYVPLLSEGRPPYAQDGFVAADDDLYSETNLLRRRSALAALECLAIAALNADIVRESGSTMSTSPSRGDSAVTQCIQELLEALSEFNLSSGYYEQAENARVPSTATSLAKAACLKGISNLFSSMGRGSIVPPRFVLKVIMGLLRDLAVGDVYVRDAARDSFVVVAQESASFGPAMGTSESLWRVVVEKHVSFVVNRLVADLSRHWAGPVLKLIVSGVGDSLSTKATALVEATLKAECDNLSGASDHRTVASLSAIMAVLNACEPRSVIWACEDVSHDLSVSMPDRSSVRKSLLAFCLEDVAEETVDGSTELPTTLGRNKYAGPPENSTNGGDSESPSRTDPFAGLASQSLSGCCDLLVGRPPHVRAAALRCASVAVTVLSDDQDELLPHVANILPLLPQQFSRPEASAASEMRRQVRMRRRKGMSSADAKAITIIESVNELAGALPVLTAASKALSALVLCAGDFVRDRFVRLVYPSLEPLLELASLSPRFDRSRPESEALPTPSFAAQDAADSALEAIDAIARILPGALRPFVRPLVAHLAPLLETKRSEDQQQQLRMDGRNRVEYERLLYRSDMAFSIIESLARHSPDETWFYLVRGDTSLSNRDILPPSERLSSILVSPGAL